VNDQTARQSQGFRFAAALLPSLILSSYWASAAHASDLDNFSANLPDEEKTGFSGQLDYLQSNHLWSAYNGLTSIGDSTQSLQNVLQQNYGINEDASVRLSLGEYGLPISQVPSLFQKAYFSVNGEVAIWGIAENPVISELHADAIGLASVSMGFTGQVPSTPIRTQMGLTAGAGIEKKTDLIGADLDAPISLNSGRVRMYGADLGVTVSTDPKQRSQAGTSLEYHGSIFVSDFEGTVPVNRWKSYSYVEIGNPDAGHSLIFKPHLVFGPQPLPVDLLPRSWDLIHRESMPGDFSAWVGGGVDLGVFVSGKDGFKATAGYYGGFWGGQFSLEFGSLSIKVGTWGLSLGPGFQAEAERLWSGSLGFRL
jgi:hypothetical protein